MNRWQRLWLLSAISLLLTPASVQASRLDDLITALAGSDDHARALARQLLPREGVRAVPKLLPLLREENQGIREAAYQVLADLANEASAPGREADRKTVATSLMTLLERGQPAEIKIRGLKLLPIVIPDDGGVGPVAALLNDKPLRERAREALEETGSAASRAALRQHLAQAGSDPQFTCAVLDSLGRLRDRDSLPLINEMTRNGDQKVRAAAARALAWTGDPTYLERVHSVALSADAATRPEALDANLRLLNNMERQSPHREAAVTGYRELLASVSGPVKDGALAGLGALVTPHAWPSS